MSLAHALISAYQALTVGLGAQWHRTADGGVFTFGAGCRFKHAKDFKFSYHIVSEYLVRAKGGLTSPSAASLRGRP